MIGNKDVQNCSGSGRSDTDPSSLGSRDNRIEALHLMSVDLARGGQVETRTICDRLDTRGHRHLAATLFRSPPGNLAPSILLNVPDGRLRRLGYDPRAARRLRRFVRARKPRIVVAHGSEALKYATLLPRSVALVYHKIGTVDDRATRGLRRRFHTLLLRRPDIVVAVSNDAAADAASFGRPDAIVVPNCREVIGPTFDPIAVGSKPLRTLFVGHLTSSKQPVVYLDVITQLRAWGVDVTGTVVGDGPLISVVRASASGDITVLGRRDDVATILQSHDVLVFTSRRGGEGMPGVLIEAGLAGRAVVAFDGPGVRDVVVDGATGFVVPQGDMDKMADHLRMLAADRERLCQMGSAAYEHCSRTFHAESVAEQWRSILRSANRGRHDPSTSSEGHRPTAGDRAGA